jgi:CcmD family protein
MKNFESLFAAYMAFWAIVFVYQLSVERRFARALEELQKLKEQLGRSS